MSKQPLIRTPSPASAFEVLCVQLADEGRGPILFGDDVARARDLVRPFIVGKQPPTAYFEFPLIGDPFLDVTLLYGALEPSTVIDSPAAAGTEEAMAWASQAARKHDSITFGYELDTSKDVLPPAAMHFQPREHTELVRPFCERLGEPERADLYLDFAERVPQGWGPSFFGLFRGRPAAPLRVCGYLGDEVVSACIDEPGYLAEVFDQVGFTAYDSAMVDQARELLRRAPSAVDYQFDIYPDGRLGNAFAFDLQFNTEVVEAARASLTEGPGARVLNHLESLGVADERWYLIADTVFARGVPTLNDDGSVSDYSFTVMPGWMKTRWIDGVLQPAKFYLLGKSGVLEKDAAE